MTSHGLSNEAAQAPPDFREKNEWRRGRGFSSRIGCRLARGEPGALSVAVRRFQFRKDFVRLYWRGRIISIW
jgi:hypothetical protein